MLYIQLYHHFGYWFLSFVEGLPSRMGIEFYDCIQFSTEGFSREFLSCFLLAMEQNLFLCAPTSELMASISVRMVRLLASVSWMILSCLVRLLRRVYSSLSFMRQLRLQMGSYLPMASRCFLSYSQWSKWISSAMKFYCLENCYTLRSMAFCSSTIFSLNLLIFSFRIFMLSQCFLCCLKILVSFCSSIIILSRMELLFTRSLPCSSAFRFSSLFSFFVPLIRERNVSASWFRSSNRLGFEARNLILSSSRLCSLLQF